MALLKKCGKTAVLMKKFIRGYIANRLQQCINQEVFYLLEHGYCDAEAIDLAVKASFIPRACVLGLCKRMDFGGVDMTANNFRNHSYEMPHPPADEPIPHVLEEMVDRGELGIKTGKGFYDYSDVDIEELKAKRDKQLFEVFRLEKKFLDDPVSKTSPSPLWGVLSGHSPRLNKKRKKERRNAKIQGRHTGPGPGQMP